MKSKKAEEEEKVKQESGNNKGGMIAAAMALLVVIHVITAYVHTSCQTRPFDLSRAAVAGIRG